MSREISMKIYLAGSISSGRKFKENISFIASLLISHGHRVLSLDNVVNLHPVDLKAKTQKDRQRIVVRDKKRIRNADAVIIEASNIGYGIGYEHRLAENFNKPVLVIRDISLRNEWQSAFFDGTGYKKLTFAFYDKNNIENILKIFFKRYFK